jgi:hypothetical protein
MSPEAAGALLPRVLAGAGPPRAILTAQPDPSQASAQ